MPRGRKVKESSGTQQEREEASSAESTLLRGRSQRKRAAPKNLSEYDLPSTTKKKVDTSHEPDKAVKRKTATEAIPLKLPVFINRNEVDKKPKIYKEEVVDDEENSPVGLSSNEQEAEFLELVNQAKQVDEETEDELIDEPRVKKEKWINIEVDDVQNNGEKGQVVGDIFKLEEQGEISDSEQLIQVENAEGVNLADFIIVKEADPGDMEAKAATRDHRGMVKQAPGTRPARKKVTGYGYKQKIIDAIVIEDNMLVSPITHHVQLQVIVKRMCPVCVLYFNSTDEMLEHIDTEHAVEMECPECSAVVSSSVALGRHALRHYTVKTTVCLVCEQDFKHYKALKRHSNFCAGKDVARDVACPWCSFVCPSVQVLVEHADYCNGTKIKEPSPFVTPRYIKTDIECDICADLYLPLQYIRHRFKHYQLELMHCRVCARQFSSQAIRQRHERLHSNFDPDAVNREVKMLIASMIGMTVENIEDEGVQQQHQQIEPKQNQMVVHGQTIIVISNPATVKSEEGPASIKIQPTAMEMESVMGECEEDHKPIMDVAPLAGGTNQFVIHSQNTQQKGGYALGSKFGEIDIRTTGCGSMPADPKTPRIEPMNRFGIMEMTFDKMVEKSSELTKLLLDDPENQEVKDQFAQLSKLITPGRLKWAKTIRCSVMYNCKFCNRQVNGGNYKTHLMTHLNVKPWQCKDCLHSFSTRSQLINHVTVNISERNIQCLKCDKTFKDKRAMQRHYLTHVDKDKRQFQCTECGKTFLNKRYLQLHMATHDGSKYRHYQCTHCNEWFSKQYVLELHKDYDCPNNPDKKEDISHEEYLQMVEKEVNKRKVDPKQLKCEICGQVFSAPCLYHVHMKRHKNERNFMCEKCDKRFVTKGQLNCHVHAVHEANKSVMCEVCGKVVKEWYLKRHNATHDTTRKRPHQCRECGLAFMDAKTLRRHALVHTRVAEYSCDQCSESFRFSNQLAAHKKKHSVDALLTCDVCGQTFVTQRQLQQHYTSHSYTRMKQHKCQVCPSTFSTRKVLVHHAQREHNLTLDRYACMNCGDSFGSHKGLFMQHIKACQLKKSMEIMKKKKQESDGSHTPPSELPSFPGHNNEVMVTEGEAEEPAVQYVVVDQDGYIIETLDVRQGETWQIGEKIVTADSVIQDVEVNENGDNGNDESEIVVESDVILGEESQAINQTELTVVKQEIVEG